MLDRLKTFTYTRREALAAGGAAFASAIATTSGCFPNPSRQSEENVLPNIVVFLSDALRANHLGTYGYSFPTSPCIDAMARTGIVFERCYSQAPWTKPSIASLFTGYLPCVHQAVLTSWDTRNLSHWDSNNPLGYKIQSLRENFPTLSEILKNQGYSTALFQTCPHCQREFGFGRGFQHYRYVPAEPPENQVNAVIEWLHATSHHPFFAFIHAIDPHGPYIPKESFYYDLFRESPEESQKKLNPRDMDIIQSFRMHYEAHASDFKKKIMNDLSPAGIDYLIKLYDSEIRGVDYHFRRLLDTLALLGIENNTIVVFMADHGEAFGEHRFFAHNNALYDEELHVPLIIRLGNKPLGVRVPWHVNLYDLFPTLITLAGGSPPDTVQAKSLLTKEGKLNVTEHRPINAYFDKNESDMNKWQFCHIEGGYKVYDLGTGQTAEIYDRTNDPKEKVNLIDEIPMASELLASTATFREKHRQLSRTFGEPQYIGTDQGTVEELRSLGYL